MRKIRRQLRYSPSDLATFMESRFAAWMERYALELPGEIEPDEPGEERELLRRKGLRHEAAVLAALRAEGRDVEEIPRGERSEHRHAATREAIRAGREVIYQAALSAGPFSGVVDFLVRVRDGTTYEPLEAKLSRNAKPTAAIQLCCYAELLEASSGGLPERLGLALGSGETLHLRTVELIHYYGRLKAAFLRFMDEWEPSGQPLPDPRANHGRWQSHADDLLERGDHVSRVARITQSQVRRLARAGIRTAHALAKSDGSCVEGIAEPTYRRLRRQAQLQLESMGRASPAYEVIPPSPGAPRRGLALLPPPGELDVFFDMEGYPLGSPPLEYLFGASHAGEGRLHFEDWWAFDRDGERRAFAGFVDWVVDRWRRDPAMHVYHYGHYEITALRRLMGELGSREHEIDQLLRHGVFVDLYEVVRSGLLVGEPRYSIKNLERLFRDARDDEVGSAMDSLVHFQRWLDSGEPPDWRASPLLQGIRRYNRDDCDSTRALADWLRRRQREHAIVWSDPADEAEPAPPDAPIPPEAAHRRELASRLTERATRDDPAHGLLAHLLEFHRREDRPMWWTMFDRHAMDEEELCDDAGCLGGLEWTGQTFGDGRTRRFRYRFDPEQETRLAAEDSCFLAGDLDAEVQIARIDLDAGIADLCFSAAALGRMAGTPPRRLSLIPNEHYRADVISRSIARTALVRLEGRDEPRALSDLLRRRRPRFVGGTRKAGGARAEASLVRAGEDPADAAVRLAPRMNETTLCIQGPPGSGKTTTAARMIVDLLGRGKRVGISSNSHKAIVNLLLKCAELRDWKLPCVKVGGKPVPELTARCRGARYLDRNNAAAPLVEPLGLIGGTAWLFSRPEMAGRVDYLFVDEAGQVCLANLVGMSPACRNLVLIGDQMQLPQPIQGAHPGESGCSTLAYLLGDAPTIPPDRGLFLGTSYRMHPKICALISEAFYEGRLAAAPGCERREIRTPDPPGPVGASAGVLFVPVEHEGNRQASGEEVAAVADLVETLVGRERTGLDGNVVGRVGHEDVLVVAPYNLQVRKLQRRLPATVRVGTVDRFQGQEAPVVIISLCASEGHESSRGLEFLLNRNRLNVALSRAQSLAIVVGNPGLLDTRCTTVEQIRLVDVLCRIAGARGGSSHTDEPGRRHDFRDETLDAAPT